MESWKIETHLWLPCCKFWEQSLTPFFEPGAISFVAVAPPSTSEKKIPVNTLIWTVLVKQRKEGEKKTTTKFPLGAAADSWLSLFISEISDLICESQPTTGFEVKVLQTKGRNDFRDGPAVPFFKAHWDVMVVLKFWHIQITWQENLSTMWKWKQSAGIAFQKWKGHASDVDELDSRLPLWVFGVRALLSHLNLSVSCRLQTPLTQGCHPDRFRTRGCNRNPIQTS